MVVMGVHDSHDTNVCSACEYTESVGKQQDFGEGNLLVSVSIDHVSLWSPTSKESVWRAK